MKKLTSILICVSIVLALCAATAFADCEINVTRLDGGFSVEVTGEFGDKDWVGIYKAGESYGTGAGNVPSLVWWYVSEIQGPLSFPEDASRVRQNRLDEFVADGDVIPGDYVIYVLSNDGYELLDEWAFREVTVEVSDHKLAIDYDASSYIGSEFRQILWNGEKYNDYEGGETPAAAIRKAQTEGEYVDVRDGGLKTLCFEGWVGFDQDIVAFGSMLNGRIVWDDSFNAGSDETIRSEDKGGQYAKKYSVSVDLEHVYGRYTVGVAAALADGTVVKLNSSDKSLNTFITFEGPERPAPTEAPATSTPAPTATPELSPTDVPATSAPATDGPSDPTGGNATDSSDATGAPATAEPGATDDNSGNGGTDDTSEKKGPGAGLVIGIAAGAAAVVLAAVVLAVTKKKK
jgi:hypothetical protein